MQILVFLVFACPRPGKCSITPKDNIQVHPSLFSFSPAFSQPLNNFPLSPLPPPDEFLPAHDYQKLQLNLKSVSIVWMGGDNRDKEAKMLKALKRDMGRGVGGKRLLRHPFFKSLLTTDSSYQVICLYVYGFVLNIFLTITKRTNKQTKRKLFVLLPMLWLSHLQL